jgi:hypothetical protein
MIKRSRRPDLSEEQIKLCHQIVDDLVRLHTETHPSKGKSSEVGKNEKAFKALNKIGLLAGILTEWAENQIFGTYYHLAKSEIKWIDGDTSDKHKNELMWYGNNLPEDVFSNDDHLICERVAIAQILHNTFSRYGRMGWRLSLEDSLYALNEGQVDWLLKPTNTNQQGNAYDLQTLKWAAVKHIYKLIGEGWKKTAAQQKIAESCGTSFEAIKKWEKECIKDRDKDKATLKAIQFGSFYLKVSKAVSPELQKNEILYESLMWNTHSKKGEPLNDMSYGAITSIKLEEEYPMESLKERLIEAGMRKAI